MKYITRRGKRIAVETVEASAAAPGGDTADRHIGCPLSWFKLVFSVVRGKNELAVALLLYRQRSIRRSKTIAVSNLGLLAELGVDRFAKYRALRRLADAGLVVVKQNGKQVPEVTLLSPKRRGKKV
jgi:hypothetical protein